METSSKPVSKGLHLEAIGIGGNSYLLTFEGWQISLSFESDGSMTQTACAVNPDGKSPIAVDLEIDRCGWVNMRTTRECCDREDLDGTV